MTLRDESSSSATMQGPPHYPTTHVKLTVMYDLVEVGTTLLEGDRLELDNWLGRDIVLRDLNTDHRLSCGPPFCRGGERPLSVQSTRWAIRVERVDARGRRLTR